LTSFHDFGLAEPITRGLAEGQYVAPTPIQTQTIPGILSRHDVIGIAQTDTGKTAAFALPILHHLFTSGLSRRKPMLGIRRREFITVLGAKCANLL
jgi:superfamily II DNA/RNA helicase